MRENPWIHDKSVDAASFSTAGSTPERSNPWRKPSSSSTLSTHGPRSRVSVEPDATARSSFRYVAPSSALRASARNDARPWEPKPYQEIGLKFLLEKSRGALWFDPGLGKTSTTLAAFCVLKERGLVNKMLVVAPVRPTELVWPQEVAKWRDFSHLRVQVLRGHRRERWLAKGAPEADVYVVNWESLEWLAREGHAAGFAWPDMWVLDESTFAKNHNSNRFSALVARAQRKSGKNKVWPYPPMLNYAKRVVELTGTPAPNSYADLWAQMFLLDQGAALGYFITHFRNEWCWQNPHQPNQFEFLAHRKDELFERIAHLVCRMSRNDWRDVPEPVVADVEVEIPAKTRATYDTLRREFAVEFKKSKWAVTGNAAGLLTKLRQVASGGIYYEASVEWSEFVTVREAEWLHDAKLDALEELMEELSGQPLLVFYGYKFEVEALRKRFGKKVPNLSGVLGAEAVKLIDRWNSGKVPLLLAHPKSAGHGLNLQEGGAHHCAWFTLPYDLEIYDQANARLDRGEQDEQVVIHRLIAKGTVDEVVAAALAQKHRSQQSLLDAMRREHGDSEDGAS